MKYTTVRLALMLLLVAACHRETAENATQTDATGTGQSGTQQVVPQAEATAAEQRESNDPQVELARGLASYELENADKTTEKVSSLHGKAVLLNVWATWCGPCRSEIPQLNQLVASSAKDGLEVIGISIDSAGSEQQVLDFGREQKIAYRIAFDPTGKIADVMQTTVVPTSVLLDRNGEVVSYLTGPVDITTAPFQQSLRQALRK